MTKRTPNEDDPTWQKFIEAIGQKPPANPNEAANDEMAVQAVVLFGIMEALLVAGFKRREAFTIFLAMLEQQLNGD